MSSATMSPRARPAIGRGRARALRTAFVFSGGASLGAMQAGMLCALYEHGIVPDLLVGTSAGALNAAFVASRPQTVATAKELARVWQGLHREDIFPVSPRTLIGGLINQRDHLVPDRGLRRLAARHLQIEHVEDASIPLHLLAFDLLTGEEMLISNGPATDAVLAAAAIPGVLPPIHRGDRLLVDGGIVNNTPISHAVELGAERIYVLPTEDPGARGVAPAPRSARRRGPRRDPARRRPPADRPRSLRHGGGADRPARDKFRSRPADRLRPRRPADRRGARGRPDGPRSHPGRRAGRSVNP